MNGREKHASFHVNGIGIDGHPPPHHSLFLIPPSNLAFPGTIGKGADCEREQILSLPLSTWPSKRVDQIRWKKGEGRRGGDFRNFYTANGRGRDETNMGK